MPDPLAQAQELYERLDANARKAVPGEPVVPDSVEAMVEVGLHAVMVPESLGGAELPIVDCIDVFAEVARADGSTGWCLMANAATIAFFGAWAGDDFVEALFAEGVPLAAGQLAPNGVAVPDGDGYRLTGDYQFGSGINHSSWVGAGVLTQEDDSRYLVALLPREQAELRGGWDVLGLEATASWDYHVEGAWVPVDATFDFFDPGEHRGGPGYELGVFGLTSAGHAGFALGVTARALEELARIGATKTRMGASGALRDSERFLIALADLDARARSAASWVRESFARAERTAVETGQVDTAELALARQATVHATHEGAAVVREAYLLAGTDALRAGPLQRCFRDLHAGTQHFFAGDFARLDAGRALLAAAEQD